MSTSLQPLSPGRRDTSLDLLRGFALTGVLFIFCVSDVGPAPAYVNSLLDEIIAWPKYLLLESRMYTMLIIIFGIGFYVQLEKAKQYQASLVPTFTRRLIGLLVIGFIHAIVLSTRDILMFYGVAGFALLLLQKTNNRQLFWCMIILFFVIDPVLIRFATGYEAFRLVQSNDYAGHVQHNWQFFKLYHQIYPIYADMLFHFMLGFMIARAGLLQMLKTNKKLRRRVLIISFAATAVLIPVYFFYIIDVVYGMVGRMNRGVLQFLAGMGLRVGWHLLMLVCVALYGTLLISLWVTAKGKNWLRPLAAFGQMALSNYLIQSLILIPYLLVFDKFSNLPPFEGFILFLVVFGLQLVFSSWWMARFTLGPFEWLLRSFTYWKWQAIRKPLIQSETPESFSLIKNQINYL